MIHLLISIVVVQIGILWAVRPLVWWYFGINRMVRALENIDASLRVLPAIKNHPVLGNRKPARAA
jgi:hypothetical protein